MNHQLGTEFDYGYRSARFHTLNSFGISRGEEYAYGTYKYEPGRYFTYQYNAQSQNRLYTGSQSYIKPISVWIGSKAMQMSIVSS